jgi:putative NIF3 family GTP cyclohydrolase 1 type 2
MTSLSDCVAYLDDVLATSEIPDYDQALNGLQLANAGTVTRLAVAVDFSHGSVQQAVLAGADFLLVHHGMFWGAPQPFVASRYERLRLAIANNLAVYASHLPLDLHPRFGNNVRLATDDLLARVQAFAQPLGTHVVCTPHSSQRRTRHWAIVTGAGASSSTLAEAADRGIDTLIVGEGPHHTAVEAQDRGIVIIYAGHYATETLGVQALADELQRMFTLPWSFVHLPTGL